MNVYVLDENVILHLYFTCFIQIMDVSGVIIPLKIAISTT